MSALCRISCLFLAIFMLTGAWSQARAIPLDYTLNECSKQEWDFDGDELFETIEINCTGAPPPDTNLMDIDTCAPGHALWEFTSRVVDCVTNVMIGALSIFLEELSEYMKPIVAVMLVLAVILFGFRLLSQEPHLAAEGTKFFIRFALVVGFVYFFITELYVYIFPIMEQLITLVWNATNQTGFAGTPWEFIDVLLGTLFGFGGSMDLMMGILGLVMALLFSSTMGIYVFVLAIGALLAFITFLFRVVFTYLLAIVTLAFMIALAPLVVPLAVFQTLEQRYFKKWLDLLISAVMQPVILFAFLGMFLGLFGQGICTLLATFNSTPCGMACGASDCDFKHLWQVNQPLFSWLMPSDPAIVKRFDDPDMFLDDPANVKAIPPVQVFMNPQLQNAMNMNVMNVPAVNFGANQMAALQMLGLNFISFLLLGALMMSMVQLIPQLAADLTAATLGLGIQELPFEQEAKSGFGKLQSKLKKAQGGWQ